MSEGQVTGKPEQNIEADCKNAIDGKFLQQVRVGGAEGDQNYWCAQHERRKYSEQT
jgi:hypothetical protein